ncbi:hypothetical protein BDQ17DRAFT_1339736, partial [Cyathus striatus]
MASYYYILSPPPTTATTESTNPFTAALPTDLHFSHPHPPPPPPKPPSSASTAERTEPKPLPPPVPTKPTEIILGTHKHNPLVRASGSTTMGQGVDFLLFLRVNLLGLIPLLLRMWEMLNPLTSLLNLRIFLSSTTTSTPSPVPVPTPSTKLAKSTPAPHEHGYGHSTSTLIRQSLQASKATQSRKRAQEMLERERNVEVLRGSGTGSVAPPPPPPRNRLQPSSKLSSSISSPAISIRAPAKGPQRGDGVTPRAPLPPPRVISKSNARKTSETEFVQPLIQTKLFRSKCDASEVPPRASFLEC